MSTSVINPNHVKIMQRFKLLIETVNHAKDVLERPHIDIMCAGLRGQIPDTEVSTLVAYMVTSFKSHSVVVRPKDIESKLRSALNPDDDSWVGRTYIGESDDQLFIQSNLKKGMERSYISNFYMEPQYTVKVEKGNKYHVYSVKIKGDPLKYSLMLEASDFNKLDILQERIKEQLGHTSANINGCSIHMKDLFYKYVTLADFESEKEGTSLIGLEVINNNKYFCTPNNIFDIDGKVSKDLMYMGNAEANLEEVRKLDNLNYDKDMWFGTIAPIFLKNIFQIHDKNAMLSILGWMGAIPHDYVIRKEAGTGFFPHCHIIGEPGSGKSTILTLLKQFMGHNDSSPRVFPTPFETSKLLNSSYTIPTILDEYGKRWDQDKTNKMNTILVESFTKSAWSRGQANLGSVYFKYKNPLLMAGQIPTSDQALASRVIPVYLYKAFHKSKNGKESYKQLTDLQRMGNKNFWVGYNLWCAQFENQDVTRIYTNFRTHARGLISDNRTADIYAVVMLGLHYMKQLAISLGIAEEELQYNDQHILDMPNILANAAGVTSNEGNSPLDDFLSDLSFFATRYGNGPSTGKIFGTGLTVMTFRPQQDGSGQYGGRSSKQNACIYGKELLLIKVDEMVKVLNERHKIDKHNEKEIMTFIEAKFKESLEDPTNETNFVLAPKQYETRYGRYTALNKKVAYEMFPEFEQIQWIDYTQK